MYLHRILPGAAILIGMLLSVTGCQPARGISANGNAAHSTRQAALQRYEYAQLLMGVQVRLVVYAPDQPSAEDACRAAFDRVAVLEDVMSDYRPDSELMRLCDRAGGAPVRVSEDLFVVLDRALEIARQSDGAFDPTVGPLVKLWRAARKAGNLPEPAALEAARAKVGWQHVHLDPRQRTVRLDLPGMKLDLGGIGKGFAGDEALATLRDHGIDSALFEAGGDIVVSDPPPGQAGWPIEVYEGEHHPGRKLTLHNAAVSTSGATEQFVEIDGVRYSHVVDPRTGIGLTNQYMATVTAARGILSDAISTACTVLGPEKGRALARHHGATLEIRKVL